MNGLCIEGLTSFYCNCLPTWTGKLCNGIREKKIGKIILIIYLFLEKIISPCSKNPCNPGKCFQLNDPIIPFVCLCPNKQFGLSCPGKYAFLYFKFYRKIEFLFHYIKYILFCFKL